MTVIEATAHADAPAGEVFAILCDVSLLTQLSTLTESVEGDPGRPLQVGDRFSQRLKVVGVPLESDWEVVELVPDQRLRVEGTGPAGARAVVEHEIVSDSAQRTALTMRVEYDLPGGVLGELADDLFVERRSTRDAQHIVEHIADLAEMRHRRAGPSGG